MDMIKEIRQKALELAAGPPDAVLLRETVGDIHLGVDVFCEAFSSHVVQEEARRQRWGCALRCAVREATQDTSAFVFQREREHTQAEFAAWRSATDPFTVWDFARNHVAYFHVPLLEFGILLQIDRKEWLEAFGAIPVPSLMWTIAWLSLVEDYDVVEELLALAPLLVDERGGWTRSAVVPILVRLVQTYAERLYHVLQGETFKAAGGSPEQAVAERILKEFEMNELPARLRRFYGTLLAREDGRAVACRLLSELAPASIGAPQAARYRSWSAERAAFDALAAVLASCGASVEEVRESWQKREVTKRQEVEVQASRPLLRDATRVRIEEHQGEGRRSLHAKGFRWLLGAVAIRAQGTATSADIERIWSWFAELLAGRDPALQLDAAKDTREEATRRLGKVLAQLPEPAASWRIAWRMLEPQRRRGQFSVRYSGDSHLDRESVILVYVGLQACGADVGALAAGESRARIHEFFWVLYAAARRLWLIAAMDVGDHRRELVAACFAFMPAIFGEALDGVIAQAIRPIEGDAWLVVRACSYLRLNGVAPERLRCLLSGAGLDIEATLREAREWAVLTGEHDAFPDDFEQLAVALGCKLDVTPVAE